MTYIMCRTLLAGGGTPSSAAAFYGVAPAGETPPASMSDSMAHGTSMPASMPASMGAASRTPRVDVVAGAAEDLSLARGDLARSAVTRWRRTRHALVCEVDGALVQVRGRGYVCMSVPPLVDDG